MSARKTAVKKAAESVEKATPEKKTSSRATKPAAKKAAASPPKQSPPKQSPPKQPPRKKAASPVRKSARKPAQTKTKPKRSASSGSRGSKPAAETSAFPRQPAKAPFPVVGIGASAGGLEALEELFNNMPSDTGMAFMVITHQHPGHTSLLPELLGKCTEMPVVEASEGVALKPNHVYVAPPGGNVSVQNKILHILKRPKNEMPPLPIDFFFRSLAQDQKDRAICIVLSGTGSDGTLGLEAVKGESGMAMAQEVRSARYAGMPSSAIGTSLADYILPPAAIPGQLVAYARAKSWPVARVSKAPEKREEGELPLQKIFQLIRARTGHDFSSYKPSTMQRRIERRISVHQVQGQRRYVRLLQENPQEIDLLFKELLIGVTCFFRDPAAFEALAEKALPELMASKPDGYVFRAWLAGCGSGEEAYTVAILLRECVKRVGKTFDFQIFGTDLDVEAIETARVGRYPAGIAADVPSELLDRYFIQEDGAYRVRKEIREMIVFAPQNVIKDPSFTRLDLLCCRNLLIYINADLQKRLFPIFHYALKPDGLLMLGLSETIGGHGNLFTAVEKKWKIYKRAETMDALVPPPMPAQPPHGKKKRQPRLAFQPEPKTPAIGVQVEKILLSRFAPASVIINDRGDILFIHGRTGAYLEPPAGQPSANIHDMAREGLQAELAGAIRQALSQDKEVARQFVRVKTNGGFTYTDLSVSRILEPETVRGLLLVTFRPSSREPGARRPRKTPRVRESSASNVQVRDLENELLRTRESLQGTVEELETSNEVSKSANEELQSTNEELQSTNEELETSKEEMQSLNEELTTVNAELQSKLEDLSRANDDMQNLLNSTDIATIFLDKRLHIKRYTERAKKIFKLIPGDIGRPLADLTSELRYAALAEDAREVLQNLSRKEMEVEARDGTQFLMRMMPYRTAENVIEGVVTTFVDMTQSRAMEAMRREAHEFFRNVLDAFTQPALVLEADLRVAFANTIFCKVFRANARKTEDRMIYEIGGGEWDTPQLHEMLEKILPGKKVLEHFEVEVDFPKTGRRLFLVNARILERKTGLSGMILLTMEEAGPGPEKSPVTHGEPVAEKP